MPLWLNHCISFTILADCPKVLRLLPGPDSKADRRQQTRWRPNKAQTTKARLFSPWENMGSMATKQMKGSDTGKPGAATY